MDQEQEGWKKYVEGDGFDIFNLSKFNFMPTGMHLDIQVVGGDNFQQLHIDDVSKEGQFYGEREWTPPI